MKIFIKKPRADNRVVVSYQYTNGCIINQLTPLHEVRCLREKYNGVQFSGNTRLLDKKPR